MLKLTGVVAAQQSHWKGQYGILVFHLKPEGLEGLPEGVKPGELPLRVRVNRRFTDVRVAIKPGVTVVVKGTLTLNEFYKGRRLPPHIDATAVKGLWET